MATTHDSVQHSTGSYFALTMVNAMRGLLVTCDPATKQFLLHLHKEHHFIMSDLDETHLLVSPSAKEFIQKKLDEHQDNITYVALI